MKLSDAFKLIKADYSNAMLTAFLVSVYTNQKQTQTIFLHSNSVIFCCPLGYI